MEGEGADDFNLGVTPGSWTGFNKAASKASEDIWKNSYVYLLLELVLKITNLITNTTAIDQRLS